MKIKERLRKKVFNHKKYITFDNNKTNDIFSNLRENQITFMDDGYQNLQKKIKSF